MIFFFLERAFSVPSGFTKIRVENKNFAYQLRVAFLLRGLGNVMALGKALGPFVTMEVSAAWRQKWRGQWKAPALLVSEKPGFSPSQYGSVFAVVVTAELH